MTEREKILARVREGLKKPASRPGLHGEVHSPALIGTQTSTARQWLPKVGETFEERLALFQKNTDGLKAEFKLFASHEELIAALARRRVDHG